MRRLVAATSLPARLPGDAGPLQWGEALRCEPGVDPAASGEEDPHPDLVCGLLTLHSSGVASDRDHRRPENVLTSMRRARVRCDDDCDAPDRFERFEPPLSCNTFMTPGAVDHGSSSVFLSISTFQWKPVGDTIHGVPVVEIRTCTKTEDRRFLYIRVENLPSGAEFKARFRILFATTNQSLGYLTRAEATSWPLADEREIIVRGHQLKLVIPKDIVKELDENHVGSRTLVFEHKLLYLVMSVGHSEQTVACMPFYRIKRQYRHYKHRQASAFDQLMPYKRPREPSPSFNQLNLLASHALAKSSLENSGKPADLEGQIDRRVPGTFVDWTLEGH